MYFLVLSLTLTIPFLTHPPGNPTPTPTPGTPPFSFNSMFFSLKCQLGSCWYFERSTVHNVDFSENHL